MFSSIVAEVLAARLRLGCSEAAARNQTYVRSGALAAASRHPRREDPSQIQWHQGCSTGVFEQKIRNPLRFSLIYFQRGPT